MPPIPTVGHGAGSSADRENRRPQRPGEQRRSELICKVKYFNTLPDIPFDCKFLAYPFDPNRFVNYVPTSLERSHRWDLLVEPDLGMRIDLVNPETYSDTGSGMLDPADEKLLEEDALVPTDSKRSRHHAKAVSWLRRTEYISTEHTRFQPSQIEKVEAKVGYNIKKNFQEEALFSMDRESQIKAIEKTFSSAKKEILRHPTKKNVTATEVLPVLPDFSSWKYPWAQVIFDADPCPPDVPQRVERDEYIASALLRGVVDPEGEQFVAFFLPTQETIDKRLEDAEAGVAYDDEKEYEYVMSREYNWNVKNKSHSSFDQNYFFIVGPEGVWYNELETRVRLMRRRRKKDQPVRTRLLVTHRPISEDEHRLMALREKALEALEEEEEDEELEQADNKDGETVKRAEPGGTESGGESAGSGSGRGSRASSFRSPAGSNRSRSRSKSGSRSSSSGSKKGSSRSSSSSSRSSSRSSRSSSKSRQSQERQKSATPTETRKSRSRSRSGTPQQKSSRAGSGSGSSGSSSSSAESE